MEYDFIEIGVSNFDTLALTCSDDQIGIIVEPIKGYIDSLPDRKNVIKVNAAVATSVEMTEAHIYYIPEEVIDSNPGIPFFFKGCNSLNDYHPLHLEHNLKEHVVTDKVPCVSIENLFKAYKVENTKYLQTDTEGGDAGIIEQVQNYMTQHPEFRPKDIMFESKYMDEEQHIRILRRFVNEFNYVIITRSLDTHVKLD